MMGKFNNQQDSYTQSIAREIEGLTKIYAPGKATIGLITSLVDWVKPKGDYGIGEAFLSAGKAFIATPGFMLVVPAMAIDGLTTAGKGVWHFIKDLPPAFHDDVIHNKQQPDDTPYFHEQINDPVLENSATKQDIDQDISQSTHDGIPTFLDTNQQHSELLQDKADTTNNTSDHELSQQPDFPIPSNLDAHEQISVSPFAPETQSNTDPEINKFVAHQNNDSDTTSNLQQSNLPDLPFLDPYGPMSITPDIKMNSTESVADHDASEHHDMPAQDTTSNLQQSNLPDLPFLDPYGPMSITPDIKMNSTESVADHDASEHHDIQTHTLPHKSHFQENLGNHNTTGDNHDHPFMDSAEKHTSSLTDHHSTHNTSHNSVDHGISSGHENHTDIAGSSHAIHQPGLFDSPSHSAATNHHSAPDFHSSHNSAGHGLFSDPGHSSLGGTSHVDHNHGAEHHGHASATAHGGGH